jgi:hypothetical protein
VWSDTADSTLWRAITAGSGLNSAAFYQRIFGPDFKDPNAAGEPSEGLTDVPLRWL